MIKHLLEWKISVNPEVRIVFLLSDQNHFLSCIYDIKPDEECSPDEELD